nr:hypothetical protein [Micromonospora cremea]
MTAYARLNAGEGTIRASWARPLPIAGGVLSPAAVASATNATGLVTTASPSRASRWTRPVASSTGRSSSRPSSRPTSGAVSASPIPQPALAAPAVAKLPVFS